jgi:hypothetical protein
MVITAISPFGRHPVAAWPRWPGGRLLRRRAVDPGNQVIEAAGMWRTMGAPDPAERLERELAAD